MRSSRIVHRRSFVALADVGLAVRGRGLPALMGANPGGYAPDPAHNVISQMRPDLPGARDAHALWLKSPKCEITRLFGRASD